MKTLFAMLFGLHLTAFGQNFAVLLAKDSAEAPAGFPTNWPHLVQPIGTETKLPPEFPPPWILATQAQIDKWKSDNVVEKEAWNVAQENAPRIAAEQAAAAKKAEIDSAITTVETGLKEWQSADEKSKGDILLKLLHVILEALKYLGADVKQIEKPEATIKP